MEVLGDLLCRHEKNIKQKSGLSKCAFKLWLCRIRTGGVGRHARRIASEQPPLLLIVLLCLDVEQEDEGALEVKVEEEDAEWKLENLASARLVWGMANACLLFRDIIIIFATEPRRVPFNKLRLRLLLLRLEFKPSRCAEISSLWRCNEIEEEDDAPSLKIAHLVVWENDLLVAPSRAVDRDVPRAPASHATCL